MQNEHSLIIDDELNDASVLFPISASVSCELANFVVISVPKIFDSIQGEIYARRCDRASGRYYDTAAAL